MADFFWGRGVGGADLSIVCFGTTSRACCVANGLYGGSLIKVILAVRFVKSGCEDFLISYNRS